jgi:hypothetical protein
MSIENPREAPRGVIVRAIASARAARVARRLLSATALTLVSAPVVLTVKR